MTLPRPHHNRLLALGAALTLLLTGCGGNTSAVRPAEVNPVISQQNMATTHTSLDTQGQSDYMMAVNSYKNSNLKTAETMFLAMTQTHPELAGPHANLGMIYNTQGESGKAEVAFNQALTLKSDMPEVYNQLAILQRNKGEFNKALQSYQAGLKVAPDNPNLLINLGILYDLYLNQPQEALKLWQRYKAISGEDKQVDTWIADINQRSISQ